MLTSNSSNRHRAFGLNVPSVRQVGIAAGTLWAIAALVWWPVARLLTNTLPGVGVSPQEGYEMFSQWSAWLPAAREVADGNLFPIASSLGTGAAGLSFLPYLTVWMDGLLLAVFGPEGATLIGAIVFPALCFVVFTRILLFYLPPRWALALAAFGCVSFSALPVRGLVFSLLAGQGWRALGIDTPVDLAHFPIPGFSLLCFLLAFYFTIRPRRVTWGWATALSLVWALQAQVHVVNAIFGLPLWFLWLAVRVRRNRGDSLRSAGTFLAVQALIAAAVCVPTVVVWLVTMQKSGIGLNFVDLESSYPDRFFGLYYIVAYFVVPLGALATVALIVRVDPYELMVKFNVIFISMAVELAVVAAKYLFGAGVIAELVFLRIGLYFLHPLYYVPVIYYLVRPEGPAYGSGTEGSALARRLRAVLQELVGTGSRYLLPLLYATLSVCVLANGFASLDVGRQAGSAMVDDRAALEELVAGAQPGDLLVSDRPVVNLMLPVRGRFGTLWVNRFSTKLSEDEALERLVLFARLVGWSQAEMNEFVLPQPYHPLTFSTRVDLREGQLSPGLGSWLIYNSAVIPEQQREGIKARADRLFASMDPREAALRMGVKRVLSRQALPGGLGVAIRKTPFGTLWAVAP